MGTTLLSLTEATQQICRSVAFPYCLLHSIDDPVVKVIGSQELHKSSQTQEQDKAYFEFENLGHNVLCNEAAFSKCMKWLQTQSRKFKTRLRKISSLNI